MAVKILKKSSESVNALIFTILSLPFIHIIKSLHAGRSAINWPALKDLVSDSPFLGGAIILAALLIYKGKKYRPI